MRTVLRPLIAVAALVALAIPSLASPASTATVPIRRLPASGGTIKWTVTIQNAKTCTWSSSPRVPGFDGTVKCKTGRVVRPAKFNANTATGARYYTLTLTVRGETTTVDYLKVEEAGESVTTTTALFTCSGNVTVTGAVAGVLGTSPNMVTVVRGTLTNGRNVAISDVTVTFVLTATDLQVMANTTVVDIPDSVPSGATVSWSGSGQAEPYPEMLDPAGYLWVSHYANDAEGINCGVDGFGSN
ncbi:MAG: hypothetical protein ABSF89_16020 [Acidimicrobiales bacterium]|jgi:hypothetical protein